MSNINSNYKPFLKRIRLTNFMLHENTDLHFKKPILIISGANGSGKTQLIEAIILALGEKAGRSKKGLSSIVGPFDNKSLIELEINNVRDDGSPIFQSTDSHLSFIIQNPIISLRVVITPQKLIRYIGAFKSPKYHQVTQRQIQSLMHSAGIRPGNQLTFTMGETVDVFANQTPYRKFQVLLENLGLSDLREEIIQNERAIKEAVKETARLQRKIEEEERNLDIFRTMIEIIRQRSKLENLLETLSIERQWIDIFSLEDELKQKQEHYDSKYSSYNQENQYIHDLEQALSKNKEQLSSTNKNYQNNKMALESNRLRIQELLSQKSGLEATVRLLQQQINENQGEISKLEKILKNKSSLLSTKQIELTNFQLELDNNQKLQKKLQLDLETIEKQQKEDRSRIPYYESMLIEHCLQFNKIIQEKKLEKEILGPIISFIHLNNREKDKKWLNSIKQAIGDYLFSFVAMNNNSYSKAKQIFDQTWPTKKPAFQVFRYQHSTQKKYNFTNEVYEFVPNLLTGESRIHNTLHRIMSTALTDKSDPNRLTTAAQANNIDILSQDGTSFYRRKGSFSRPPKPFHTKLGKILKEPKKAKELRQDFNNLQEKLLILGQKRSSFVNAIASLRDELTLTKSSDQAIIARIDIARDQIKKNQQNKDGSINSIAKSEKLIQDQKIEKAKLDSMQLDIERAIKEKEKEITANETLLSDAKEKLTIAQEQLRLIKEQLKQLREKIQSQIMEAKKLGPRPSEQRTSHEVDLELKEVRTKLAMIKDKSIDIDKLESQEKYVVDLRENDGFRRDHLEKLRNDIDKRLEAWKSQIEPFIIQLEEKLKDLTSEIFSNVRLFIDAPPEKLEDAGLVLQAVTKEAWRQDKWLSSGEKVLLMESLILALHSLAISPLHVIDEFTQRLDIKNKTKIFKIVHAILKDKQNNQFILISPDTLGMELNHVNVQHVVVSQAQVKSL